MMPAGETRDRVLVVDDEEYVRGLLGNMLDSLGFESIAASDGDKGLEAFQADDEIVACVIDLTMPGMGGLELLEHIRALNTDVPVLLVSGYARHEVRQREAKSSNVSFLQKPFTLDQFRNSMSVQLKLPTL